MSAIEVIETIKLLPRQEQAQVVSFIHTLEQQFTPNPATAKVSDEFKRLADEVFTTNDELFRKLAQ
jgi:Mrp family chromosome partitioning ATPase